MAGLRGMSATTGKALDGKDHLMQSIRDILTTPIGARVMRRDYGSRVPELMDRPTEPGLTMEIYAAVTEALETWETRFRLRRIQVETAEAGRLELNLSGEYRPDGTAITLEGIIV